MTLFDKDTYGANLIPEVILPIVKSCNHGSRYFRIVNDGKHTDMYGQRHFEICGNGKEISEMIQRLEKEQGMIYHFADYEELPMLPARGKYYLVMRPYDPFYRVKDKTGTYDVHHPF